MQDIIATLPIIKPAYLSSAKSTSSSFIWRKIWVAESISIWKLSSSAAPTTGFTYMTHFLGSVGTISLLGQEPTMIIVSYFWMKLSHACCQNFDHAYLKYSCSLITHITAGSDSASPAIALTNDSPPLVNDCQIVDVAALTASLKFLPLYLSRTRRCMALALDSNLPSLS